MKSEKRLIDANELKIAFKMREMADIDEYGVHIAECFPGHEANLIVDTIPTVDAVEVVHGRWIHVDDEEYECNQCRNHACFDEQLDMSVPAYNYCPNCGAKMDGDEK